MKLPSRVALVWAQSLNDVIGRNGKIPEEFYSDLVYFKKLTIKQTVVMGRKTWESLTLKPLPHRTNVVLTSDKDYQVPEGVQVIHSLDDLEVHTDAVFFIGGTEVYNLGYPFANEIYITINRCNIVGDTYSPYYPDVGNERNGWKLVHHQNRASPNREKRQIQFVYNKHKEIQDEQVH